MDGAPVMGCLDPVHHSGLMSRCFISHGPPLVDADFTAQLPTHLRHHLEKGVNQRLETEVVQIHRRLEFAAAFDATAHEICDQGYVVLDLSLFAVISLPDVGCGCSDKHCKNRRCHSELRSASCHPLGDAQRMDLDWAFLSDSGR